MLVSCVTVDSRLVAAVVVLNTTRVLNSTVGGYAIDPTTMSEHSRLYMKLVLLSLLIEGAGPSALPNRFGLLDVKMLPAPPRSDPTCRPCSWPHS